MRRHSAGRNADGLRYSSGTALMVRWNLGQKVGSDEGMVPGALTVKHSV